jgi:hypothetical protein
MLALAFHFGYTTARAQAPGNPVVAAFSDATVVTANGDVYRGNGGLGNAYNTPWTFVTNVFSGGPTPTSQESWGQLKSRYAPSHAPTSQTPPNK